MQLIISIILLLSVGVMEVVAVALHFKSIDLEGKAKDENPGANVGRGDVQALLRAGVYIAGSV